jgi:uncharacterized membrane protein (UPF0127 family)
MRFRTLLLLGGWLAATSAGCDGTKPSGSAPTTTAPSSTAAAPAPGPRPLHLNHAQPRLATVKLWVGAKEINAEMCLTLQQLATGLMFRPGIGEEEAMLFVFPEPQRTAFYMKNVSFDIDAAYIDPDGVITEIVRLKKMDETPVPAKSDSIQYVLETAPGWFERNGIKAGALVRSAKRSLREEFGFN